MLFTQSICTVHILRPVIWCPCPKLIRTHYWCNVQDMSRPCPGRVQQAVDLELFWTCSWRTLPTKYIYKNVFDPMYMYPYLKSVTKYKHLLPECLASLIRKSFLWHMTPHCLSAFDFMPSQKPTLACVFCSEISMKSFKNTCTCLSLLLYYAITHTLYICWYVFLIFLHTLI